LSNPKISTSHDRFPALPKDILIEIVSSEGVTTAFVKNSDRLIIFGDVADVSKRITVPLDADRKTFCALAVERIATRSPAPLFGTDVRMDWRGLARRFGMGLASRENCLMEDGKPSDSPRFKSYT
jgi:hypothetical protein